MGGQAKSSSSMLPDKLLVHASHHQFIMCSVEVYITEYALLRSKFRNMADIFWTYLAQGYGAHLKG
jgi:hypothetical protein